MTSAGDTIEIEIEVGLHLGSALRPLLSMIIIGVITEDIEEGSPWAMLFADDLELCDPDRDLTRFNKIALQGTSQMAVD